MSGTRHLFVYGSLLSGAGHEMGARLAHEAERVGPATMAGRLYRVEWFPAAVPSDRAGELVHGEVYRLAEARPPAWLDAYEDVDPGTCLGRDYVRVVRAVRLDDGRGLDAWVYLWRQPTDGLETIASGRWLDAR